jgi:hypothetical protein
MEKKTLSERYADEVLTDNTALNHYSQCKGCVFRDKTTVSGEECGWQKAVCHIYGRSTASRLKYSNGELVFPYTPVEPSDKPNEVYNNTANCEFYEQEKRKK